MNYYEILKVSKNASQQEIRDSYINLIKQYHPDIYKGTKEYGEKITKELNDAYDVLSVPEKRRDYDLSLEPPTSQYTPPDFNYTAYKTYSKYYKTPKSEEPPKETIDFFLKKNIHKFVDEKVGKMSKEAKRNLITGIIIVAILFTLISVHDYVKLRNIVQTRKELQEYKKQQQLVEKYEKELEENTTNTINI